ncbi:hypothetical protein ACA910_014045 [Epithemia clementina (nom. ined.)]
MEDEQSPGSVRFISEEHHVTREQAALAEMAYRLSSSNVVGDHEDVGSTRREAKLLMSLSAFPQSPNQSDLELLSSSESDSSYMSDASTRCSDSFTIVCPSLSLDNSPASTLQHAYREKRSLNRRSDDFSDSSPAPAKLLGRPLHADDRNAVRLSADAMALNVCDSFRRALQWRINTWTEALSKSIAAKEKAMVANGATTEELKTLLSSSEVTLILNLNVIEDRIKLTCTRTRFTVLPQRVEKEDEPSFKKRRSMPRRQLEESEYQYLVAHAVRFECSVELDTPAGFTEVTLEVPGSMDGTFFTSGIDEEELTAVALDINTEMLAAMVEKSCRQIVRVSLESLLNEPQKPETERYDSPKTVTLLEEETSGKESSDPARKLIHEFSTPPPARTNTFSTEEVRAALVSPPQGDSPKRSRSGFICPLPDDLDSFSPRRISPQRHNDFKKTFSSIGATPLTPKAPITTGGTLALVSPNPQQSATYTEFSTPGPSLPVLVEVACRAYRND